MAGVEVLEVDDVYVPLSDGMDRPLRGKAVARTSRRRKQLLAVAVTACLALLIGVTVYLETRGASGGGSKRKKADSRPLAPVKPAVDPRDFRYVYLDNGMTVLLVSDNRSENAAAAVSYGVGSLQDPEDYQGLAHFLEHMVFLGSAQYPNASLDTYLSVNNGRTNAFTSLEITNYFFQVATPALEGAATRLLSALSEPLLPATGVATEVRAVNDEFVNALNNDGWRDFHLSRILAAPDNAWAGFSTGNEASLQHGDLRGALAAFYRRYYSSRIASAVLYSPQPMSELLAMSSRLFATSVQPPLPSHDVDIAPLPAEPYGASRRGFVIKWLPLQGVNRLSLRFPAPPVSQSPTASIGSFLADQLASSADGSVATRLRAAGLITALDVRVDVTVRAFSIVAVEATLTADGLDAWEDVTTQLFQAITLMRHRGLRRDAFQLMVTMEEAAWQFRPPPAAASNAARDLASAMQFVPLDFVLDPPSLWRWDEQLLASVLAAMTAERALIMLSSPSFSVDDLPLRDPIYATPYSRVAISAAQRSAWSPTLASLPSALQLPPASNAFAPTSLQLADVADAAEPQLLSNDSHGDAWWQPSLAFSAPQTVLHVKLFGMPPSSPRQRVLAELFADLLAQALTSGDIGVAAAAGMSVSSSLPNSGLQLTLAGWSASMPRFLSAVLDAVNGVQQTTQAAFQSALAEYTAQLRGQATSPALTQAVNGHDAILRQPFYSRAQLLAAAEASGAQAVTLQALQSTARGLLTETRLRTLAVGSVTSQAAASMHSSVRDRLAVGADVSPPPRTRRALPAGRWLLRAADSNAAGDSDAVLASWRIGTAAMSPAREAAARVLNSVAYSRCFDALRTQQALGYRAGCQASLRGGLWGFLSFVQGSDHNASLILQRMHAFVQTALPAQLAAMPPADFASARSGVIDSLLAASSSLQDVAATSWQALLDRNGDFSRTRAVADALKTLQLEDVVQLLNEAVAAPVGVSSLSYAVYRASTPLPPPTADVPPGMQLVDDAAAFKAAMPLLRLADVSGAPPPPQAAPITSPLTPPLPVRQMAYFNATNGLRLLAISDSSQSAGGAVLWTAAGALSEPPSHTGLAQLVAATLAASPSLAVPLANSGGSSTARTTAASSRLALHLQDGTQLDSVLRPWGSAIAAAAQGGSLPAAQLSSTLTALQAQRTAAAASAGACATASLQALAAPAPTSSASALHWRSQLDGAALNGSQTPAAAGSFAAAAYAPQLMTLVVYSSAAVDTLLQTAQAALADSLLALPHSGAQLPAAAAVGQPGGLSAGAAGQVQWVTTPAGGSAHAQPQLRVMWPLPASWQQPATRPRALLLSALNSQHSGGLPATLRAQGFALSCTATLALDAPTAAALTVTVPLTEQGESSWQTVVAIIMQYVRTLAAAPDGRAWPLLQADMAAASLSWQNSAPPSSLRAAALAAAAAMPRKQALAVTRPPQRWQLGSTALRSLLSALKLDAATVQLTSARLTPPAAPAGATQRTAVLRCAWQSAAMTEAQLLAWSTDVHAISLLPPPSPPAANAFMPSAPVTPSGGSGGSQPSEAANSAAAVIYTAQPGSSQRLQLRLLLRAQSAYDSAAAAASASIAAQAVQLQLDASLAAGRLLGVSAAARATPLGVAIALNGLAGGMAAGVAAVRSALAAVVDGSYLTAPRFSALQRATAASSALPRPAQAVVRDTVAALFVHRHWTAAQLSAAVSSPAFLRTTTMSAAQSFITAAQLQALAVGSTASPADMTTLLAPLTTPPGFALTGDASDPAGNAALTAVAAGNYTVRVSGDSEAVLSADAQLAASASVSHFVFGSAWRSADDSARAQLLLLTRLMQRTCASFFAAVTKPAVFAPACDSFNIAGLTGLRITASSRRGTPTQLAAAIDDFIAAFASGTLAELSDADLDVLKQRLSAQLTAPAASQATLADTWAATLAAGSSRWEDGQLLAAAMSTIDLATLRTTFADHVSGAGRRMVAVQVWSPELGAIPTTAPPDGSQLLPPAQFDAKKAEWGQLS